MDTQEWLRKNGDRSEKDLKTYDDGSFYVLMADGFGDFCMVFLDGRKSISLRKIKELNEVHYCKRHEVNRDEVPCLLCSHLNRVVDKQLVRKYGI